MSDSASESESDQVDNPANELSPVLFGRIRKEINHIKETLSGMDEGRFHLTSRCMSNLLRFIIIVCAVKPCFMTAL